ncbi:SH3 domain-containing protein [Fodinibius salsisoli]|uniref:SH3 domain-containing protein n=1 Tax=Fodinibius salsisoli TaxID=2820877 RepID=A0ABT3PK77_9BACT|nr:SH3 domain-containing protein [Fodinibius salsisoli]MCW9706319.1 hypothetical protein [Fodinibius salsisoli]
MHINSLRFTVLIVALSGLGFIYGCSSSTWEDAQQADTYEAYQAYIEDNPNGEHLEVAKIRSDSLYWATIQNDTTAQRFESYLNQFPDGQFKSEAQIKLNQISSSSLAAEGRVTGSNIIIRSDHTTESSSAGVVAKEGTVVQILDQYKTGSSSEAILKRDITVDYEGRSITVTSGKAIRILADRSDSVEASFSVSNYGVIEATISKNDIEAMSGQKWYKIHTKDGITGWIYGKFVEEL